MTDPKHTKPDVPPSPERDTSRKGGEEEVINQQEEDMVTNTESDSVVNGTTASQPNTGERQFREGVADNTVKLDEVNGENLEGSDVTGDEESGLPGSGV